jgi:hypothetical protein
MSKNEQTDSPALAFLRTAYEAGEAKSRRKMGYGMRYALKAALHLGLKFAPGDVGEFVRRLGGSEAFGAGLGERSYAEACDLRHESACRSFESHYGRPAFVYEGKRLVLGQHLRWDGKWVTATSFGEHKGEAVVNWCQYSYERKDGGGTEKKIVARGRLTLAQVKEAEKARVAKVKRTNLVNDLGSKLDGWVSGTARDVMRYAMAAWTMGQLQEAKAWHEAHKKELYQHLVKDAPGRATMPAFVAEAIASAEAARARSKAKDKLREALRAKNYGQGYPSEYHVTDKQIDALIAGKPIEEVLSLGILVQCKRCKGGGYLEKTECKACGKDNYPKCPDCEGAKLVPYKAEAPDWRPLESTGEDAHAAVSS